LKNRSAKRNWILSAAIPTPDGVFRASFSEQGLIWLGFPSHRVFRLVISPPGGNLAGDLARWVLLTQAALQNALAGVALDDLPPLDLSAGTPFQRRVWTALCAILPGETRTYAQLALAVGQPQASRAVGQACGANPIPVLIPCHRVVAAHGGLGGFSAGLKWKQLLLAREGIGFSYIERGVARRWS
jgi:O-6-methylguanine DNA methyltransferase